MPERFKLKGAGKGVKANARKFIEKIRSGQMKVHSSRSRHDKVPQAQVEQASSGRGGRQRRRLKSAVQLTALAETDIWRSIFFSIGHLEIVDQ